MQKVIDGLGSFREGAFRSRRELFERLAHGQHPEALFITCSDSRIDPNLLTQTAPGDLFILRNAGNIVPPYGTVSGGEAATIEFAIAGLGIRDVIVCGHSHCGAMRALVDPREAEGMPALVRWLTHAEATGRIVRESYKHLQGDALLDAAIQENVLVQLENLKTHPAVAASLARRELHLHGWVYRIENGLVAAFDPREGQFVAVPSADGHIPEGTRSPIRTI